MLRACARLHLAACKNPAVSRLACLAVGTTCFLLAVLPMVYFAGFLANLGVPKGVDSGPGAQAGAALAVDLALVLSFGVVHSLLARRAGKAWMSRLVPQALTRAVYSGVAGAQILALVVFWRPLPGVVWSLASPLARGLVWLLFALAWGVVLWALWAVDATRLFGLRPAWAAARGRLDAPPEVTVRGPYRHLRHPLYGATIVALFAAPEMSHGRLLLATLLTAYILVGVRLEERDLARELGESYLAYRRAVPGFLPWPRRRGAAG